MKNTTHSAHSIPKNKVIGRTSAISTIFDNIYLLLHNKLTNYLLSVSFLS
jgi:hypothetical protein